MGDTGKLFGRVRGLQVDTLYGTESETKQIEVSGQGDQLYALESDYSEISRLGRSFWCNTAVAVASVIAMPTTAQAFALYNNEPDGGRSYIIDQVWWINAAVPATHCQAELVAVLGQVREAVPTNAMSATVTVKQLNGLGKNDTRARVILTATALPATTGFAGNWKQIGDPITTGVNSLPGMMTVCNPQGRYIVMPGRYFAVHCVANAITVTGQFGIGWTERYLMNG